MTRLNAVMLAAWTAQTALMAALALWISRRSRSATADLQRERAQRTELEAYARLDPSLAPRQSPRDLAKRVCATVAQHSNFRQVALLLADAEGRLNVVGSAGVDDLMAHAVNAWVARFARDRRRTGRSAERFASYPVALSTADSPGLPPLGHHSRPAVILPLWSTADQQTADLLGALVVWPSITATQPAAEKAIPGRQDLVPLEALARKLGRAIDMAHVGDRLLRAEKMAGLGNLAKGLAHELNNPLTAVLGYAELLADTASDPRVATDAEAIRTQALRMKHTVDRLLRFWRPVAPSSQTLNLAALLHAFAETQRPELTRQGIRLDLRIDDHCSAALIRGQQENLTEMLAHLVRNATQAIAAYPHREADVRAIRLSLACHEDSIRLSVADTGAGFLDPARAFDPFYTTREPGEGQGLGLAVSFGIAHEHGGEISAQNIHPHGAAVVVELPLARTLKDVPDFTTVEA